MGVFVNELFGHVCGPSKTKRQDPGQLRRMLISSGGRGGVSCIIDVLVRVEEGHGDAMHDRRGVERERAEPLVLDFALDLDQVGSTVVRTMERVSLDACSPDATWPHAFEPE